MVSNFIIISSNQNSGIGRKTQDKKRLRLSNSPAMHGGMVSHQRAMRKARYLHEMDGKPDSYITHRD